jgi:glycosyltransferase involved in cell wall biosynthesis
MRTIIGGPAAEPSAPDERGESARPRVLVFAFACEPGRGSEPGAGWGTVRALSTFADCVVLVGPEHAAGISRWQASGGRPGLTFVVVPEARWPGPGRGGRVAPFIAYLRWLPRAYEAARRLQAERPFDLVHHVSYSTYWLPTPAAHLGVPLLWGPVGGAVTTPRRLWPALGWLGLAEEFLDYAAVRALAALPATHSTWQRAARCLAQNDATLARLPEPLRDSARVLNHALFTDVATDVPASDVRERGSELLFVASLESRKGLRLAVRAMRHTPADVTLRVVGDGPERRPAERLARRLGVADRIQFRGRVSRATVLDLMARCAAAVFTGLREEGGLALAEALLTGTPVVVLAHGGALTVAAAATDPSRVALVEPGDVESTARRIGEAMTRFSRHPPRATGPLLDQAHALRLLRETFEAALAGSGSQPVRRDTALPARS